VVWLATREMVRISTVVAAVSTATPLVAHHSFARFDTGREVHLEGVVQEFSWTNPHAWIILAVDRKGRSEQWAIEMSGPSTLARQGWRPRTLVTGMLVKVIVRPLRDGTNGGQFLEITLPDGIILDSGTAHRF
jgi:hypothetical protein